MTATERGATIPKDGVADVIVIGAGIAGASVARALADRGLEAAVLERAGRVAAESSGRSAEMVRQHADDEAIARVLRRGAALHRESGRGRFHRTGSYLIGRGDEPVARRVPIATGRGLHVPDDGVTDATRLVGELLEGIPLMLGEEVASLDVREPRVVVTTASGHEMAASVVVNAAGAWAGALPDLPLPLTPMLRHLFQTTPRAVDAEWPWVWDDAEGFYFRPSGNGLLLCACDDEPTSPGDTAPRDAARRLLIAKARRLQPGLEPLSLADGWAGQRTFAPDHRFVVGFDPRVRGIFHLAALGGHGITAAPALAELAASMVLEGPDALPPPEARPFAVERLLG